MTRSIRKAQKRLRKKAKPQDCHAQAEKYWPRELRNRSRLKDALSDTEASPR